MIKVFGTIHDLLCYSTQKEIGFLPQCQARVENGLKVYYERARISHSPAKAGI